jgi:hypothetical protein
MYNIIYYQGSYYIQSDRYKGVFKVTTSINEVTTIEIVPVMPAYNYGEFVDIHDVVIDSIYENLIQFIKKLLEK